MATPSTRTGVTTGPGERAGYGPGMATIPGAVLLGTVALEPNRWATVDPSGAPQLDLARWLPTLAAGGFDGLELWERHATSLPDGHPLPVVVLNSYASFDDPDPAARRAVAEEARRLGVRAVKVNVGSDPAAHDAYAERLAAFVADLPPEAVVVCECHHGTVAEVPAVAAAILGAAGPADRVQALVHTHEPPAHLAERFAAYGERITHVHVNFLDTAALRVPLLADRRAELAAAATALRELGYRGSWTLEFVAGVLGPHDRPEDTVPQAIADLAVLRDVLGEVAA